MSTLFNVSVVLFKSAIEDIFSMIKHLSTIQDCKTIYLIDHSPKSYQEHYRDFKKVKYWHNPKNPGFGSGHNRALKASLVHKVNYHFVINPDIDLKPEAVKKMQDFMVNNPNITMLMPKIINEKKEMQYLCKLLPSPYVLFARRFLQPIFKNSRMNQQFEMRMASYNQPFKVPFLSGCFWLLRTQAVAKIGFFDERFFLFCEDIDLCRRMWKLSPPLFYPFASIVHKHRRKKFTNINFFYIYLMATIRYFNKWGWFWDRRKKQINKEAIKYIQH